MIQPAGLGGEAGARPTPQRLDERGLDRLLGDVDVAEDADPDGDRAAVRNTRSIDDGSGT